MDPAVKPILGEDQAVLAASLNQIGARFDPGVLAATRELYRKPAQALPWAGREGVYDLAYGEHERQRLDVYRPANVNRTENLRAPVVLFIHGGGFVSGDKRSDAVFYGNVGRYFAACGYLAVLANYRLAPAATWPSGTEDVAAALNWVHEHSGEYGGNKERVILIGQSAGATHVAGYLFGPGASARDDHWIRGAALMSGIYRARHPMESGWQLYFGEDEVAWSDRSPARHVTSNHPPVLLSVAELDPGPIARHTFDIAEALSTADGRPPQVLWFKGHNHVSTVHGLGIGGDTVGRALCDFIERCIW